MGASDPKRAGSPDDGDVADGSGAPSADVDRDAGTAASSGESDDRVDEAAAGPRLKRGVFGAEVSGERKVSRLEKRRSKIREEIERNRRGEYTVPTWVLAVALVAFVAGWVALIVFV